MDSTTPAIQSNEASGLAGPPSVIDPLAMVTAAVQNPATFANNLNAAALLNPNAHLLNALNSAFPLYSVTAAGTTTTNFLSAIVATSGSLAPVQAASSTNPQSAGSSFGQQAPQDQNAIRSLLSTSHPCLCSGLPTTNDSLTSQVLPLVEEHRPTPSSCLRQSRKRHLPDALRTSGSNGVPNRKFPRVSSSSLGTNRPDTPILSPNVTPPQIVQTPGTNIPENFIESVVNAAFLQQQHVQPQQATNQQPCPVCSRQQIPTARIAGVPNLLGPQPGVLPSTVALQPSNLALAAASTSQAFVLPSHFTPNQPAASIQLAGLASIDDASSSNCVCTGFHCARCVAADQRSDGFDAWRLPPTAPTNGPPLQQPPENPQMVDLMRLVSRFSQQQQFPTAVLPATQSHHFHYQTPILPRPFSLLQTSIPAASLSRPISHHQMTRTSSLNGSAPFPTPQTAHPDHLNILSHRQQAQRQSNDYRNRFYATNSVVLPQPGQTNPAAQQMAPATLDLHSNPITLRRLAPASAAALPYNQSLFFLSNIHNLYHQPTSDMPMIFLQTPSNADLMYGNTEAVTHAVTAAMQHAPEPQPIGATSEQIKRCTQIRNYVKDLEVPENERERCTVCLMDFETGEDIRTLNCSHMFHIDCIDRWLNYNKKCPICRVDMDKLQMLITDNEEDETLGIAAAAQ